MKYNYVTWGSIKLKLKHQRILTTKQFLLKTFEMIVIALKKFLKTRICLLGTLIALTFSEFMDYE